MHDVWGWEYLRTHERMLVAFVLVHGPYPSHLGVRHEERQAEAARTRLEDADAIENVLLDFGSLGRRNAEESHVIGPRTLAAGPSLYAEQVV